jgi:hypothetical protein
VIPGCSHNGGQPAAAGRVSLALTARTGSADVTP